ncbi:MAG: hypothetical protein CL398_07735 [Acidiferrobacteraceae bacterium]|nr:hypothetical protein [Acidiferrobacteraceae bacterium]|tara:strand:- start:1813 stop:2595 length:783 start_codon:yes stop_codon:yes gene_type:complete
MLAITVIVATILMIWLATKHWPIRPGEGREFSNSIDYRSDKTECFTVGTFNIHRGRGIDGIRSLARISDTICDCDVVGLQEVEGYSLRNSKNQAYLLAEYGQYAVHFSPTRKQLFLPHRGNALLTRYPVSYWCREPLFPTHGKAYRNLTMYTLQISGQEVHVINTHLSKPTDQNAPLQRVLELFVSLERAVLVGDFNTHACHPLIQEITNLQAVDATSLSSEDPNRVDWILVRGLEIVSATYIPASASDHPFYSAELRLM